MCTGNKHLSSRVCHATPAHKWMKKNENRKFCSRFGFDLILWFLGMYDTNGNLLMDGTAWTWIPSTHVRSSANTREVDATSQSKQTQVWWWLKWIKAHLRLLWTLWLHIEEDQQNTFQSLAVHMSGVGFAS